MIQVFQYLDYQDFLRDSYLEQKEAKSFYSYRYIERKTGISASFYARILLKKKNIPLAKIEHLANFLELQGNEKEYFICLVHFNRAKDEKTAQELFFKLSRLKNSSGVEIKNLSYFSQWQAVTLRELLKTYAFDGNFKELGQQFIPPITAKEAKSAFQLLKRLKLIEEDQQGIPRPRDQTLTTGDQWHSHAVRSFQKSMIEKASTAIDIIDPEERDITSITVGASKKTLVDIRERLAQARKEIFEIIATEPETDAVYQMNFQIFPLTQNNTAKK